MNFLNSMNSVLFLNIIAAGLGTWGAKFISLLTIYFIGTYLTIEQTGIYSGIIGLMSLFTALQNGGIEPLIVKRRIHQKKLINLYLNYALQINMIVCSVAIPISYLKFYGSHTSILIISIILLNFLISPGYLYLKTKFISNQTFKLLSLTELLLTIAQQSIIIIMLILLESELALVLGFFPLIFLSAFLLFQNLKLKKIVPRKLMILTKQSKWLMISAFLAAGIINSPYILIEWLQGAEAAGIYFFGASMMFMFSSLISRPIQVAFLPKLVDDKRKQITYKDEFVSSYTKISFIIFALSTLMTFLLPHVFDFIWQNKWTTSAVIAQIMVLSFGCRVTNQTINNFAQLNDDWFLRPLMLFVELSAILVLIIIFCRGTNDIVQIATIISFTTIVFSIGYELFYKFFYELKGWKVIIGKLVMLFGVIYVA